MNLLALQVTLQAITATAIAGGLIYTAAQFRAWRRAQHVANFTKLVELQMQLRRMRVDDPSLARIYKHDVDGLKTDEEIRFYYMNLMQLSLFEIVWFSRRQGQIPEDYFQSWVRRMQAIEQEDSFKRMIRNPAMKIMHDDFQRFVSDLTGEPIRA